MAPRVSASAIAGTRDVNPWVQYKEYFYFDTVRVFLENDVTYGNYQLYPRDAISRTEGCEHTDDNESECG